MTGDALPDCPVDFKASRVMVARRLIGARKLSACVKSVEGWVCVVVKCAYKQSMLETQCFVHVCVCMRICACVSVCVFVCMQVCACVCKISTYYS